MNVKKKLVRSPGEIALEFNPATNRYNNPGHWPPLNEVVVDPIEVNPFDTQQIN